MNIKLTFLLLAISVLASAQNFEPGKITATELNQKAHPANPQASAAILHKTGNTSFNYNDDGKWEVITDVKVRTKIYNKEGYKYANVVIPFTPGKDIVEVHEAFTYNPEGDKISKTKINIPKNTAPGKKTTDIIFTDVKEGSIIEYAYTLKSTNITTPADWYFQQEIPVDKSEYTIAVPEFFIYNKIVSPYFPVKEKQEKNERVKRFNNISAKGVSNSSNSTIQSGGSRINFKEDVFTYTADNVPAFKDEKYMDNGKNYLSYIKHQLSRTEVPGSPFKTYDSDWNTIVKSIYNQKNVSGEIALANYYVKDIDAVIKGLTSHNDIMNAVFNYVKTRMAWNGEYGYETKKGVAKAYAEKTGSAAEINLMLVSMLRYAGFIVNPVFLSTRDKGHITFVSPDAFNYVIVAAELKNGVILLDATSKNAMPDILPVRGLNMTGMMIKQNLTLEEINLMPKSISKKNTAIKATVLPDGTVSGEVKNQYYDYNAFVFREHYKDKVAPVINDMQVTKYTVTNIDEYIKPVTEDITFISDNIAEVKEGKIYISPLLYNTVKQNPFAAETRTYPVDFIYPQQERFTINITIPQGYEVESMPDAAELAMDNNFAAFKYSIFKKDNQIQIIAVKNISAPVIGPESYKDLRSFYQKMVQQQSKKIVLKKA